MSEEREIVEGGKAIMDVLGVQSWHSLYRRRERGCPIKADRMGGLYAVKDELIAWERSITVNNGQ